jgi:hypothetical protein
MLGLCVGDREARAHCQCGELIDRIAASEPVRKLLLVEAVGHTRMPFGSPGRGRAGHNRRASYSGRDADAEGRLITLADDRARRFQPNADATTLVDTGAFGGNSPNDILGGQYRCHVTATLTRRFTDPRNCWC